METEIKVGKIYKQKNHVHATDRTTFKVLEVTPNIVYVDQLYNNATKGQKHRQVWTRTEFSDSFEILTTCETCNRPI